MFILKTKYADNTYDIYDTEDNSTDKCTRNEIINFIKLGISIAGVSYRNNRYYFKTQAVNPIDKPIKPKAGVVLSNPKKFIWSKDFDNQVADAVSKYISTSNKLKDEFELARVGAVAKSVPINETAYMVCVRVKLARKKDRDLRSFFAVVYYVTDEFNQTSRVIAKGTKQGVYVSLLSEYFDTCELEAVIPIVCNNANSTFPSYAIVTKRMDMYPNGMDTYINVYTTGYVAGGVVKEQWKLVSTVFYEKVSMPTFFCQCEISGEYKDDTLSLLFRNSSLGKQFKAGIKIRKPSKDDINSLSTSKYVYSCYKDGMQAIK